MLSDLLREMFDLILEASIRTPDSFDLIVPLLEGLLESPHEGLSLLLAREQLIYL